MTRAKAVQVDVGLSRQLTELKREKQGLQKRVILLQADNAASMSGFQRFAWLTDTPEKFHYYTGLSRDEINVLFKFLEPNIYNLKMWRNEAKPENRKHALELQLCLTLLRLRRGYPITDMAYQYKMGKDTIGCIFVTYIQLMYKNSAKFARKCLRPALSTICFLGFSRTPSCQICGM